MHVVSGTVLETEDVRATGIRVKTWYFVSPQRVAVFINGPVTYWKGFKMAALRCALLCNHKFLTHIITVFNIQNNASYALMPTTNTETTSERISLQNRNGSSELILCSCICW